MTRFPARLANSFLAVLASLVLCATVPAAIPQEAHQPQTVGVDNTKMGPYRAPAHLAYAAEQKGDFVTAAQLTKILERVWDKAEDYGSDAALAKSIPELFKRADKAMDDFIAAVQAGTKAPADAAKLKATYNNYLEKLHMAD